MTRSITFRRATEADAAVLAAFGAKSFADTFGAFHTPADLAMHLTEAFGVAQQTAELEDPATVTAMCEGEWVGRAVRLSDTGALLV